MGQLSRHDPLPDGPSAAEVANFESTHTGGPTLQPLRPLWVQPMHNAWNTALAKVFVEAYIKRDDALVRGSKRTVEKAFFNFLETLIKKKTEQDLAGKIDPSSLTKKAKIAQAKAGNQDNVARRQVRQYPCVRISRLSHGLPHT